MCTPSVWGTTGAWVLHGFARSGGRREKVFADAEGRDRKKKIYDPRQKKRGGEKEKFHRPREPM